MPESLLEVKNLRTAFFTEAGTLYAVDDVSFSLEKGKTLGIVGESGCGKSVTALSIMRLIPTPPGQIVSGEILYKGRNLAKLSNREMRQIRGNEISMIFQEPMTSLNPVFTIGNQIQEAIKLHQDLPRRERRNKTIEMLRLVGISAPEKRIDDYPHQLSGGMRQRVMIAMALSCNPQLLIADEPSTALDVTIQAQILDLLRKLRDELGMALMIITHDLGVVAEIADDVIVMYAAKVVEKADVYTIFEHPMHPYTIGLLGSIPSLQAADKEKKERLRTIPGIVPDLLHLPKGCRFQDRCPWVDTKSFEAEPPLEELEPGHWVACFYATSHVPPRKEIPKRDYRR
ncbi:MAG: ABC transporter ATP-binding protein [Deltaproteobacteria bacterium]|nr:ABC transporter ATP-binding protein [Deltaproteobacteria bacterium]